MIFTEADIVVREHPTRAGRNLHYGFMCPRCCLRIVEVIQLDRDEILIRRDLIADFVSLVFAHLTRPGACREVRGELRNVHELVSVP